MSCDVLVSSHQEAPLDSKLNIKTRPRKKNSSYLEAPLDSNALCRHCFATETWTKRSFFFHFSICFFPLWRLDKALQRKLGRKIPAGGLG